jgi:nucleotide-binding universal stress UspA family protein
VQTTSDTTSNLEPTVATAGSMFDRLLVGIDYCMESHRALGIALELQRTHGSAVRLFHAAEGCGSDDWLGGIGSPSVGGDWVTESLLRLRRFIANVAPDSASRIEVGARVGDVVSGVRAEIRDWKPTLVIIAADVHARMSRSPAERLVHDSTVPVLIIPTTDE